MKIGALLAVITAACGTVRADIIPLAVFENHDEIPTQNLATVIEVNAAGSGVDLVFHNTSTMDAVITAIYIEAAASAYLLAPPTVVGGPGVVFQAGATPPSPPGSIAALGGAWGGTLYSYKASNPPMQKGIGPGESLTLSFAAAQGAASIADALMGGSFRIVEHIQGGNDGSSIWSATVPAPGAAGVLGTAGVLLAGRRRRARG